MGINNTFIYADIHKTLHISTRINIRLLFTYFSSYTEKNLIELTKHLVKYQRIGNLFEFIRIIYSTNKISEPKLAIVQVDQKNLINLNRIPVTSTRFLILFIFL